MATPYARRSTGVSAPPTTVSAERRRQTDLPEKSAPARHIPPARSSLASVQSACRLQTRRLHIPVSSWSYAALLIRRHTSRRRHQSSALLAVRPTRLVTMGDRAFPVAGSRLWNSLPHEVTCMYMYMYVCMYDSATISSEPEIVPFDPPTPKTLALNQICSGSDAPCARHSPLNYSLLLCS